MSNDLTTTEPMTGKSLLAMMAELPNVADQLSSEMGAGGSYLKFSGKTGQFSFNGQVIDHGTLLAFNMPMTEKGFVCYKDDSVPPGGRISYPVFSQQQLPAQAELEAIISGPWRQGEGWKKTMTFHVRFLDDGAEASLTIGGTGVYPATALFKDWYGKQLQNVDDDGEPMVPLIELGAEEKKLKQVVGSYWVPTFKIKEWVSASELVAELGESKKKPAPAAKAVPAATKAAPAAKAAPARTGFGSGLRGART